MNGQNILHSSTDDDKKCNRKTSDKTDLYLVHLSIHGLVKSRDIELGSNADTGGQVKYVVELVKELEGRKEVGRVDLITRLVKDNKFSKDYSQREEMIGMKARIVRLPFGPEGYMAKETLWPYLDELVKECLIHFDNVKRIPDAIHAHYADAGCVGRNLSEILRVPFIFTGHSLGRVKLDSLFDKGVSEDEADKKYNIKRRIQEEEHSLLHTNLIVASTSQEILEQYSLYNNFPKQCSHVIPPGVDFSRFESKRILKNLSRIAVELKRFLTDIRKPIILTVARADEKKNLGALVRAFALDKFLRNNANLIVLAGHRYKLKSLDPGAQEVWTGLLKIIDDEDLYGVVAYPKTHLQEDIPAYMALTRATKGIFVNPALNEPFGLTLLEAGAAGLPVVSTNNGGPVDIISNVCHGLLVDSSKDSEIAKAIRKIIQDHKLWTSFSKAGKSVCEHYSWRKHVSSYLSLLKSL